MADAWKTESLGTAECWQILEVHHVGRLALVGLDQVPDLYPVNFTVYEGAVYLRSARDTKLRQIAANPVAALEADGEDETIRWSVVVRGAIVRVFDEDEIFRSGVLRQVSSVLRAKPFVLKIEPHAVTGRRFPLPPARPVPPPAAAPQPAAETPVTSRATAPITIPHHRPFPD
ncbi:pyridoxamine 5'-phosphate oxidase family protein [Microbacterium sp. X-17]|uniref:pyridoxamine 5'-phosphate oxidase family protein n=1 Tax=Microbacterium sp. X-17 TaxID=3144404 RepID=UPI0031F4B8F7